MLPLNIDINRKDILVSVVMCTYNGEKYVKQQIDSILNQTHSNFELIIADDHSTDGTPDILQTYSHKYHNVHVTINETNLGYIKNFEKALLLAKGDYITLSDQDDIWLSNKIEVLLQNINQSDIIYCDSMMIDENGNCLGRKMSDVINQCQYDDCLMYAVGAWTPGHAQLVKRSLLEKCIPLPTMVAHDFWLGFVASCYNGVNYYDEPLVLYRQHENNLAGATTFRKTKKNQKKTNAEKNALKRSRMNLLYSKCPVHLPQKKIYAMLAKSYQDFSFASNWLRAKTFFRYRHRILAYKKKNGLMKTMFCVKMFFKIY